MPFSGSAPNKAFGRDNGTNSGATTWALDEAASAGILSARHDTHDEDIKTALNLLLMRDGGNKPTAPINAGGYGFTNLGELSSENESDLASSPTTDVLGEGSLLINITGTTPITSLGTGTNQFKIVRFAGILTLTHHATALILPTGANITTAAGDTMIVTSDGSSNARVGAYNRADGTALAVTATAMAQLTDGDSWAAEVAVASGATCDILGAASNKIEITGTTTITSFGTGTEKIRFVRFSGALTLTHHTTTLILPGGANITTVAGDTCLVISDGSSNCRVSYYTKATGKAVIESIPTMVAATAGNSWTGEVAVASGATCDILGAASNIIEITGTNTITSLGTGTEKFKYVRFSGILTLTHNATSLILPGGANITTAAGDTMIVTSDGSSNARVVSYTVAARAPSGGLAQVRSSQPTTDVTSVAVSRLSSYDIVSVYAVFNGSGNGGSQNWTFQARVSAGTWRVLGTAASQARSSSVRIYFHISNFKTATEKPFWGITWSGEPPLDSSNSTNLSQAEFGNDGQKLHAGLATWNEVWDEVRVTSNRSHGIEGTTADRRGRMIVCGG